MRSENETQEQKQAKIAVEGGRTRWYVREEQDTTYGKSRMIYTGRAE
jgi:hypothetical protein